jgi:hypothetical protein
LVLKESAPLWTAFLDGNNFFSTFTIVLDSKSDSSF